MQGGALAGIVCEEAFAGSLALIAVNEGWFSANTVVDFEWFPRSCGRSFGQDTCVVLAISNGFFAFRAGLCALGIFGVFVDAELFVATDEVWIALA